MKKIFWNCKSFSEYIFNKNNKESKKMHLIEPKIDMRQKLQN